MKIEKDNRFEISTKNKKLILKINEATLEDAGTYIVSIGSGLRSQAKLTVNEIPIVFKMPLADQRGKEGHSVTFECQVNRGDKPVKWFANGEPINVKTGKYLTSQDRTRLQLTINDLDLINVFYIVAQQQQLAYRWQQWSLVPEIACCFFISKNLSSEHKQPIRLVTYPG